MSAAWVSRETVVDGKRKRQKLDQGVCGIGKADEFVVLWMDPDGRLKQERIKEMRGKPAKKLADKRAEQITAQLTLGTYEDKTATTWKTFREEFSRKRVSEKRGSTQKRYNESLDLFEELCSPKLVRAITTRTVEDFRAKLRARPGKKSKAMSPASVNKHLRHLKAALRKAHAWSYLPTMPQIEMMAEPKKSPRYMLAEHFDEIYAKCELANLPADRPYSAADWWRALLLTGLMTGMRIGEMLSLRWDDVHLDKGYLKVWHNLTKAKRDDTIPLHPVVVAHLKQIQDIGQGVFEWPLGERALLDEFHRLQREAGIHLDCRDDHEHTATCHVYGFHSLKKACGTLNAARLPEAVLGAFMRHSSPEVTRKYYQNREGVLDGCLAGMYVPKSVSQAAGE